MTQGLKVAVAASGLGHIARGIESWAADLAAALHDRGIDVTLFQGGGTPVAPHARVLPSLPRDDPRNARWAARIPRGLDWRLGLHAGYPLEQSSFAWSLWPVLRRERFDILHVQDPLVARRLEQLRGLGLLRTRTILAHGTEEPPAFLRHFRYLQHLAPTHLEACRAAGAWRPEWTAIGNFVDTARFHPGSAPALRRELGIPDEAFVLVTLAAIKRHHKRIDWLIDATARLRARHPEMPLVLVIAGGREDETDALVAEGTARLGDAVRFLVRYPRERIPELLRAADLFVLASLFEMMPIALLEAGASGLPCLTHDDATMRWMTGAGGVTADLTDADAFGAAVHRLWSDPAMRHRTGANARAWTEATFAAEPVVARIVAYYSRVLGRTLTAASPESRAVTP